MHKMYVYPHKYNQLCFFSYKKKDADLSVAQGRIKDLEVLFHRSEAELNTVLNEKRSLEAEVADLRAQLAKVRP